SVFECKSEGDVKEYVGSKIDIHRHPSGLATVKFTQPVLVQKLRDEFNIPSGAPPKTPAPPGSVLLKGDGSNTLVGKDIKEYRSGTAVLMYMEQWSRPEIYNRTLECARMMSAPNATHMEALQRLMHYVTSTGNRGLELTPDRAWDDSKDFKFRIKGRSDADYATNPDDRRSVSGGRVFLEGCPESFRSATQKFVCLSVTESESASGVVVAQDMLYRCVG
ncbi:hypothetical protein ACHAWF_002020, partial [Thalassiosira exigua]